MLGIIFAILFGMIIGSFLNVCIYRIPKGESIVYPGSHCTSCSHPLNRLDLVPILSFIFLKGKCRYCKIKISPRYLIIELIMGMLYGLLYYQLGFSLESMRYAFFSAIILVLIMIDWDHMILHTRIILFGGVIGIAFRILQAAQYRDLTFVWEALLASAVGYGLFYITFYLSKLLLKKEGLGFGDVRLMGMIGIYLSLNLLFFTLFISSILASFYGIMVLYVKKKSEPFPFGPFIGSAALIAVFYGYTVLDWYGSFFGIS